MCELFQKENDGVKLLIGNRILKLADRRHCKKHQTILALPFEWRDGNTRKIQKHEYIYITSQALFSTQVKYSKEYQNTTNCV